MELVKRHATLILLTFAGALAGWLWWKFVGCTSGCAITSHPLRSSLYGAIMGALTGNLFTNTNKK